MSLIIENRILTRVDEVNDGCPLTGMSDVPSVKR